MRILSVSVKGYRSIDDVFINLDGLNIFHGANGVGKTNLYNALKLVQAAATGEFSKFIVREGGMQSILSESSKRSAERSKIILEVRFSTFPDDGYYSYRITAGLVPQKNVFGEKIVLGDGFEFEPQIKNEKLSFYDGRKTHILMVRENSFLKVMGREMAMLDMTNSIRLFPSATALNSLTDAERFPEVLRIKHEIMGWRFYHGFRTDIESPIRKPCYAVSGTVLDSCGTNLAAVLATQKYIVQDLDVIEKLIADTFGGATLDISKPERTVSFGLRFAHSNRTSNAWELSDGTLQYICLVVALTSGSLPPFIVLNEPDNSLHPDMLRSLAGLISSASKRSQIWVVTHSPILKDILEESGAFKSRHVIKRGLHTWIEGLTLNGDVDAL
ncbi:AAA family ATPase [Pseudomonas sp. RA_15y_Pfl2_54]|uniref:AAA family ATPase n=1 Tax=Pseudomonas sp. RA_15y_Pfl2_54 TaxID=3088704 RepID=UPI0030D94EF7